MKLYIIVGKSLSKYRIIGSCIYMYVDEDDSVPCACSTNMRSCISEVYTHVQCTCTSIKSLNCLCRILVVGLTTSEVVYHRE